MTLLQLRQKYIEDGRPAAVGIINKAIAAMPSGELTDVINEAFALDRDLADEINCIYLEARHG
jgi:hypothetical protein